MISADKISLRQQIRQHRRRLSPARQSRAAQQVCMRIMRTAWWRKATHIAFYWPADGELSVLPLLRWSLRKGKHCYLPVVTGGDLEFRPFKRGQPLRHNRYGIPEPVTTQTRDIQRLDIILLPLVAFDKGCNRLGMGAGFYDRALAAGPRQRPRLFGVAHELQKAPQLPTDPWDVPVDAVFTECRAYRRN